jgi:hypothetical protein
MYFSFARNILRTCVLWFGMAVCLSNRVDASVNQYIVFDPTLGQGNGSSTSPWNAYHTGGSIDSFMSTIRLMYGNLDVFIGIGPGSYKSGGIDVGDNWMILGSGIDVTSIRLEDTTPFSASHHAGYVFSGNPSTFYIWDLTIDVAWGQQPNRDTVAYSAGGISVRCLNGVVQRVKIKDFGAKGDAASCTYTEAFPLSFHTYGTQSSHISVEECEVRDFTAVGAAYATAISITTYWIGSDANCNIFVGGQIPFGTRTSQSARVSNNKVFNVREGHAYGCSFTEQAVFSYNEATNCKTGFNCDTGMNKDVTMYGNVFTQVNQGVQMGAPSPTGLWSTGGMNGCTNGVTVDAYFRGIQIVNNVFELKGPYWNANLTPSCNGRGPSYEYSFGVRFGGQNDSWTVSGNTFRSLLGAQSQSNGMYGFAYGPSPGVGTDGGNSYDDVLTQTVLNPSIYWP